MVHFLITKHFGSDKTTISKGRHLRVICSALLILLWGAGCSAGLGSGLRPEIERSPSSSFSDVKIAIGLLEDLRSPHTVGNFQGEDLEIEGEPLHYVRTAIDEAFAREGFEQAAFGAPVVTLKLNQWALDIKRETLFMDANSSSGVEVQVFYPRDKMVYRGRFEGSSAYSAPVVSRERLEKLMGDSLLFAIQAFVQDPEFQRVVRDLSS